MTGWLLWFVSFLWGIIFSLRTIWWWWLSVILAYIVWVFACLSWITSRFAKWKFFVYLSWIRQWLFFSFWAFFGVTCAWCVVMISSVRQYRMLCPQDFSRNLLVSLAVHGWQECHRDDIVTGDFVVVDRSRAWRFVIEAEDDNRRYSLQSSSVFRPGDRLWLTTRVNYPRRINTQSILYRPFVSRVQAGSSSVFGEYSFDYAQWLVMNDIVGVIRDPEVIIYPQGPLGKVFRIQRWIDDRLGKVFDDRFAHGLFAWLFIGDISLFSESEYQTFVDAWLIHLVAVSGWNIMMLLVFLSFFFRFLPLYPWLIAQVFVVVLYVIVCWFDASIVRAGIMTVLAIFAMSLGREVSIFRLMAITWVAMVCINPISMVADLGMLLSFFALSWIIITDALCTFFGWFDRGWIGWLIRWYVLPCVGASIGVAPLLFFFMGQRNILWLLANIVLAPFVPLGMIASLLVTLFAWWWWIMGFIWPLLTMVAHWLLRIGEWTQQYGIRILIVSRPMRWIFLIIGIVLHSFWLRFFGVYYPTIKNDDRE